MTGASDGDLSRRIEGTWALISYEARSTDDPDDIVYPLGREPQGYLVYTSDGYMATQFMASGRPLFTHPDPHSATIDERASAAATYVSYSGPFSIDGDVVVHHVDISLMPNWIGQDQRRTSRFDGPTLTLTATRPLLLDGQSRIASLSWRRP